MQTPVRIHFKNIPFEYLQYFRDHLDPTEYRCNTLTLNTFSITVECSFVAIDSDKMFVGFSNDTSFLVSFNDIKPEEVEIVYGKFKTKEK